RGVPVPQQAVRQRAAQGRGARRRRAQQGAPRAVGRSRETRATHGAARGARNRVSRHLDGAPRRRRLHRDRQSLAGGRGDGYHRADPRTRSVIDHLDEDGKPCARHPAPSVDSILALATVGSRMPSFHHDSASKLQSLVMALDELSEIAETAGDADMQRAAATATTALRELQALFNTNRALTRAPQPVKVSLGELIGRAAERAGLVVQGDVPAVHVEANVSALTHAFAVVFDLSAGAIKLGRAVAISATQGSGHVTLRVRAPGSAKSVTTQPSEMIAIATFAIRRDRGDLCCARGDAFVIKLPVS